VPLSRVSGLGRIAVVLVLIAGVLPFFELLMRRTAVDDADKFLAGEIDSQDFTTNVLGYMMVGLVQGMVTLAAAVLTIIWMFRIAKNLRILHRGTTWGPGWAIGGWVAPPMVYVIPTLMFAELWKASNPEVPVGGDWRSGRSSPLPIVWGVLYTVPQLIAFALESGSLLDQLGGTEETIAKQITGSQTSDIVLAICSLAAAIAFALLARQLTDRHRRLTGESSA